jgi:preprotein translocase subunit SecE
LIINAVIIAVIILIAVILIVKFRAKLGDFMRSVKSELKKIVWSSKENTRKGFIVVVVIAVIFAIMLGLIDFAFNTGISMFRELLH